MKPKGLHNYFVYITTNKTKRVLYTGATNNLSRRIKEHTEYAQSDKTRFTGRYNAYYLIYWERFQFVDQALAREKQIKGWTRKRKEELINSFNPEWKFLNDEINL